MDYDKTETKSSYDKKIQEPRSTTIRRRLLSTKKKKLGILLIDHGSKRKASNEHLNSIAASYQSTWDEITAANDGDDDDGDDAIDSSRVIQEVVVRASHMEIAPPSILDTLRRLILEDEVTTAICVPYFLSPGKHATIDVPELIDEAREILNEEGLLDYDYEGGDGGDGGRVEIRSSKALGSNVDGMLKVVDGLVRNTLDEGGEYGATSGIIFDDIRDRDDNVQESKEEQRELSNRITLLEGNINEAGHPPHRSRVQTQG